MFEILGHLPYPKRQRLYFYETGELLLIYFSHGEDARNNSWQILCRRQCDISWCMSRLSEDECRQVPEIFPTYWLLKKLCLYLKYWDTLILYHTCPRSQRAHDVNITSPERRCNVMTLHRRWGDVIFTSCACRGVTKACLKYMTLTLSWFIIPPDKRG